MANAVFLWVRVILYVLCCSLSVFYEESVISVFKMYPESDCIWCCSWQPCHIPSHTWVWKLDFLGLGLFTLLLGLWTQGEWCFQDRGDPRWVFHWKFCNGCISESYLSSFRQTHPTFPCPLRSSHSEFLPVHTHSSLKTLAVAVHSSLRNCCKPLF